MRKWWRRGRRWRRCNHFQQRGIYGDEINATGGLRAQCLICKRFLEELPSFNKLVIFDGVYEFLENGKISSLTPPGIVLRMEPPPQFLRPFDARSIIKGDNLRGQGEEQETQ